MFTFQRPQSTEAPTSWNLFIQTKHFNDYQTLSIQHSKKFTLYKHFEDQSFKKQPTHSLIWWVKSMDLNICLTHCYTKPTSFAKHSYTNLLDSQLVKRILSFASQLLWAIFFHLYCDRNRQSVPSLWLTSFFQIQWLSYLTICSRQYWNCDFLSRASLFSKIIYFEKGF